MAFHEVRIPTNASYKTGGGPGFNTGILVLDSGLDHTTSRWSSARRPYNAKYTVKSYDDMYTILEFYIARLGPAIGFRWKDWIDYATTQNGRSATDYEDSDAPAFDDENIGTGDGTAFMFQLRKSYTSGPVTRYRTIEKPVAGTVKVGVDGVQKTEGVDWTVDTTTGIVTFTTPPANGLAVTAGCEFDVPVRFGKEIDFQLPIDLEAFDIANIPDIPLVERKSGVELEDEYFYGGAQDFGSMSADITVSVLSGRLLRFNPQSAGLKVRLPVSDNLPLGGPFWIVRNDSATNTLDVRDHTDTSVTVIGTQSAAEFYLSESGATREWIAI